MRVCGFGFRPKMSLFRPKLLQIHFKKSCFLSALRLRLGGFSLPLRPFVPAMVRSPFRSLVICWFPAFYRFGNRAFYVQLFLYPFCTSFCMVPPVKGNAPFCFLFCPLRAFYLLQVVLYSPAPKTALKTISGGFFFLLVVCGTETK